MPHTPSSTKRLNRRLTMQALYQLDVTGEADPSVLAESLDDEHDTPEARDAAARFAVSAWSARAGYDTLATELAPDWPTHRQPPIDRAILRLACHEIATGQTPPKVAINEAVQLAKQFAAENSPAFINGLLDKAAKRLTPAAGTAPDPATGDAWLDDAVRNDEWRGPHDESMTKSD